MEDETNAKGWVYSNKIQLLKVALVLLVSFLIFLLAYKTYFMNKAVDEKNTEMKEYAKQMENIIHDPDSLNFITWKDQKDGILFCENPAYKAKNRDDLNLTAVLKEEINQLLYEVASKSNDIQKLFKKEKLYLEQLEKLKLEYQINKKKVVEEGSQFANTGHAFREFK